ncbi:MAG: DUF2059 domain-containing protein [Verrucomicrobiaceae bacterium]|nr:DUF2059 domain-containing protein [Verrucomicrobiaceae bacterium]
MKTLIALLSCSVLALSSVSSQEVMSPEMRAALMKFVELNGELAGLKAAPGQLVAALKPIAPSLPDEFWVKAEKKMNVDALLEELLPIYAKHYTLNEVKDLIAFYGTPTGQKFAVHQQLTTQEGFTIGQAWGVKAGAALRADVEEAKKALGK